MASTHVIDQMCDQISNTIRVFSYLTFKGSLIKKKAATILYHNTKVVPGHSIVPVDVFSALIVFPMKTTVARLMAEGVGGDEGGG